MAMSVPRQGAKAADDLDVIRENEYEYTGVVGSRPRLLTSPSSWITACLILFTLLFIF
jgi:hypothetical protein